MAIQRILAEEMVSVTEMRKNPTDFFTDHPIAVLNKNQTAGYMIGKELFESMVDLIRQLQTQESFTARFQPSATVLRSVADGSAQYLASAKEEDMGEFTE